MPSVSLVKVMALEEQVTVWEVLQLTEQLASEQVSEAKEWVWVFLSRHQVS